MSGVDMLGICSKVRNTKPARAAVIVDGSSGEV